MNLLDENIEDEHWHTLLGWRLHVRKIGKDFGRLGMSDEEIIPLLHRSKSVTFFTYDIDYFRPRLCHVRYCLVRLVPDLGKIAETIQKFLRHPEFRTWKQRQGKVIQVAPEDMVVWSVKAQKPHIVMW